MVKNKMRKIIYQNHLMTLLWKAFLYSKEKAPYIHRIIFNKIHFSYLLKVKGYKRLYFDRKITNGIFEVFLNKEMEQVIKINRKDSKSSIRLYKKLKNSKEYEKYRKTILTSAEMQYLTEHTCPVIKVYKDGGYESPYIKGMNIQVLYLQLLEGKISLSKNEIDEIVEAINNLYLNLKKYYSKNGYLPGDWMLHNLVYDKLSKKILNVDIEGFYNYSGFVPERINDNYLKKLRNELTVVSNIHAK